VHGLIIRSLRILPCCREGSGNLGRGRDTGARGYIHAKRRRFIGTKTPLVWIVGVSAWGWCYTEGLLAVGVRLDDGRVLEVCWNTIAVEASVEDPLEFDADVDAHGHSDGQEEQRAAQQRVRQHLDLTRLRELSWMPGEERGIRNWSRRV